MGYKFLQGNESVGGIIQWDTQTDSKNNQSIVHITVRCWGHNGTIEEIENGFQRIYLCGAFVSRNGVFLTEINGSCSSINQGSGREVTTVIPPESDDEIEEEVVELVIEGGSVILDDYVRIEHDYFDGTGPNVTVSVFLESDIWGDSDETEVSFQLHKCYWTKDPSSVYISAVEAQMGDTLLLSVSQSDPTYNHELLYQFEEKTVNIQRSVGSSYLWTIPDISDLCADAISGQCTIICKTWTKNGYYRGASKTTFVLHVPDPTIPTIDDADITLGKKRSITCVRNSSYFTILLEYEFQDTTGTIAQGAIENYEWTPSYALAKEFPTLIETIGTIKCTTLNGTAVVGTKTIAVQFIVPENDNTKPILNGVTISPVSDLPKDFAGLYLRGKTGLIAEISADSLYSNIKEYLVTAGSTRATGNPSIIDLLADDGEVKITVKVTDQRGFTRSTSRTIMVLPYSKPRIVPCAGYSNVICERALESGELSHKGTYLAIKAGKTFSSVIQNGIEKNGCSLRYRWKMNGAISFTDWITLLEEGSTETEVSMLIGNIVNSLQTSYVVQIEAVDVLNGHHTLTFQVMTEAISFVLYDGPDGAGFGKYPEEPHVVDIAAHMTLRVRGRFVVDGNGWIALALASGISESVYAYGRNNVSACAYQVSNGNHVHISFNCALSYVGTAMVVNGDPIPENCRPTNTVYSLCPVNDRGIALVSISTDGHIRIEWVQKLADTVQTGAASITWIDGYLDYWT